MARILPQDCIFDKFEACFNHDGQYVLSGSYQNCFHLLSCDGAALPSAFDAHRPDEFALRF